MERKDQEENPPAPKKNKKWETICGLISSWINTKLESNVNKSSDKRKELKWKDQMKTTAALTRKIIKKYRERQMKTNKLLAEDMHLRKPIKETTKKRENGQGKSDQMNTKFPICCSNSIWYRNRFYLFIFYFFFLQLKQAMCQQIRV